MAVTRIHGSRRDAPVVDRTGEQCGAPEIPSQCHQHRRWWPPVVCIALYFVLAFVWYGHLSSIGPNHLTGPPDMDTTVQISWLSWTSVAFPHLPTLFSAPWMNFPKGQNFGVNGSMLAVGVFVLPITKLFGVVTAWNIGLRIAIVASATAMCLVLRRWTTWWPAAFVGGLLYGFSAYSQWDQYYMFLLFVPLPPLILLFLP